MLALGVGLVLLASASEPVPLIVSVRFQEADSVRLEGSGVQFAPAENGRALRFEGKGGKAVMTSPPLLNRLGESFTITVWAKLDQMPRPGTKTALVCKRPAGWRGSPFILSVDSDGRIVAEGDNGQGWPGNYGSGPCVKPGKWSHFALVWEAGATGRLLLDGKRVATKEAEFGLASNTEDLVFGFDEVSPFSFVGEIRSFCAYATALDDGQLAQEMAGKLETRPAALQDFPPPRQVTRLRLSRADMPEAFRSRRDGNYDGTTCQAAQRRSGPDAVDWVAITLDGKPVFTENSEQNVVLPLQEDEAMRPLGRKKEDHVLNPGDHWVRMLKWFWDQRNVYSYDPTVNGFGTVGELLVFPLNMRGNGDNGVRDVEVRWKGAVVYSNAGPLRSLTLLLPQGEYAVSVAGQKADVSVGFQDVVPMRPEARFRTVELTLANGVRLKTPDRPDTFPHLDAWSEALKDMANGVGLDRPTVGASRLPLAARVGVEAPLSPVATQGVALQAGMSSGWLNGSFHVPGFEGNAEEYARHLRNIGFDRVFEVVRDLDNPMGALSTETTLEACRKQGVALGVVPVGTHSPNIALFASGLPEYWRPTLRDLQVLAQKLNRYPNFVGIEQGADNAGYVPYWDWAGPIMNRPWMRALSAYLKQPAPRFPLGPGLTPSKDIEYRASQKELVAFLDKYAATTAQYGGFSKAVKEVDPRLMWISGSYGSSPGAGATGGWPFASIPGYLMHRDVANMTAYDWNEHSSSKPMHNAALVDRLRSWYPEKPCGAIVDDFMLFFGREARRRAYAMSLARGVDAVGTTFLAHAKAKPEAVADYKDLFCWVHRLGGAFRGAKPVASIGIVFSHQQAISRPVVNDDRIYEGSHEGKTTEAMVLCQAAGWPARIVTTEELQRGPLEPSIRALLMVGLNRFDGTWSWSEGLEPQLRTFAARGGRILLDDESECPVSGVKTGMRIAAYTQQSPGDKTPVILERNRANIGFLQRAMEGVPRPLATSGDPTAWCVPFRTGDVDYVLVANWSSTPGTNASQVVPGRSVTVTMPQGRKIVDLEAMKAVVGPSVVCDLTQKSVRLYAVSTKTPSKLELEYVALADARVAVRLVSDVNGWPVTLKTTVGQDPVTQYGATGSTVILPLKVSEAAGAYVQAQALGLEVKAKAAVPNGLAVPSVAKEGRIARFFARKEVPVVVGLTPDQKADPARVKQAQAMVQSLAKAGRKATIRLVEPNDLILSLQPVLSETRYPQWRTIEADLVLFGTAKDNPLIYDQVRGGLVPKADRGMAVALSPFVGGYWVLNVLGDGGLR